MKPLHLAIVALFIAMPAAQADSLESTPFWRGIAITHTMAWAPMGPSGHYDAQAYEKRARTLRDAELLELRREGFDFVRLAVDPGPFLQAADARRDELDLLLKESVTQILSSGLAVIVDFHPGDRNESYGAQALVAGAEAEVFRSYVRLLSRTARLLAGSSSRRVALELMNEPPLPTPAWQPMLEAAYAAVRRAAPDLIVIVGGGNEGTAAGLMALHVDKFAQDPNALFTFHYYEPYQFTHQGAPWNAARYLTDVPYPALARPADETLRATAETIDAADIPAVKKVIARLDARRQIERYRQSEFSRGNIERAFGLVEQWARRYAIPPNRILLGEFGARQDETRRNPEQAASRVRWFRDVREAAELRGFSWAAWAYRGEGGFALAGQSPTGIDSAIVDALGLNGVGNRGAVGSKSQTWMSR